MTKNKIGLIVGFFSALIHLIWSLGVALMPLSVESLVNWFYALHHIDFPFAIIIPFVPANAVVLVIITFIFGYVLGWVLGVIRDMVTRKRR